MDADEPVTAQGDSPERLLGKDLGPLSLEALHAYVDALHAEIARVRDAIAAKQRAREGAAGLFKL